MIRRAGGAAALLGLCATAAAAADLPADVRAHVSDAGRYFTDARGMALYTYAQDQVPGKSACVKDCALQWPPLIAAAGATAAGDWTLIERDDATRQWAWRGRPLYRYAKDSYTGSRAGDGIGNAWHAALERIALPPGFALRSIHLGRVLTDARGQTLYWRSDERGASRSPDPERCVDRCLADWSSVAAPWLARSMGDWSVRGRADGQKQWAFRGRRLYSHRADLQPGDTGGHGLDKVWEAAVLDPTPPLPAWVTIQNSDMGEVYADERGHTLYVFGGQLERAKKLMCDDTCLQKFWRTLPAKPDAQASGDWTVMSGAAGGKVWAYRGDVLYTHNRDREPGAIGGDKWAAGVSGGGGGFTPLRRRRDREE
jgi:predicted lipoprotein with Yx(FWY)xxD motif